MENNAQQGTTSWLAWRSKGVGASDVPILLNLSPWKTPLQLWEEKTGRVKYEGSGPSGNFATQRGQWLESEARAQYELLADCDMPPILVVHPEYPFMRVSLDGYNAELSRVLEIKCPGREDHAKALAGKVPDKYYPQVQYQLMCTGAKTAHYYSYDGEAGCVVEVQADPEYQQMLLEKVKHFWTVNVMQDVAPEPTSRDKAHITDDAGVALFTEYKGVKGQIDALTAKLEEIKDAIISKFGGLGRPVEAAGVQLYFQTRKGSVDYDAIPELVGVNLDAYRKPGVQVPVLKVSKE